MGMESFRVDFIYESTTQKELVDYLKTGFKIENNYFRARKFFISKNVLFENSYRIEDYVIAHFNDSETTFSLEACFSNFEKYTVSFYQIYLFLNEKFDVKIKLGKEPLIENLDFPNFQKLLNDFYGTKYDSFLEKYSIKNTDMFTGEFFYKNYKKVK